MANDTFVIPFVQLTTQSWYVGLQWADAFLKGNTLGMAVGQPTFVTDVSYRNDFDRELRQSLLMATTPGSGGISSKSPTTSL